MLDQKIKATADQLEKYHIDSKNEVFVISLFKVIEERCDELDYIIDENGYEIHHREYTRVATSIYNYEVYFSL